MRVVRADRPSDYGCAVCGARLVRQAFTDERADLWCPTCELVRGVVVPGRKLVGSGIVPGTSAPTRPAGSRNETRAETRTG